jgi:HlyD family secretion protein
MARRKRGELATLQRSRAIQQDLVNQGLKAAKDLIALDREIIAVEGEIDAYEREARTLRAQMVATAEVKSNASGRVVEVVKSAGDKVVEDEPLFRLEPTRRTGEAQYCDGQVHAILYIPASQAGRVRPGQPARVSPADVKREEYGFIVGKVAWIASYPASTADMTAKLQNDQLVRAFMGYGPVFEARVCLERDPQNTANAFRWSSSRGPERAIDAGTPATASIVVEERRPYTYLIPAIKRSAGF